MAENSPYQQGIGVVDHGKRIMDESSDTYILRPSTIVICLLLATMRQRFGAWPSLAAAKWKFLGSDDQEVRSKPINTACGGSSYRYPSLVSLM
jgi:hypothetical protein